MSEIVIYRGSILEPIEIIEGELVSPGAVHLMCGGWHSFIESSSLIMCCGCSHAHDLDAPCVAPGPCGSYLCCIG